MPIGEANARHLLRRTEFVDRSSRVAEIASLSVQDAVANVLDTVAATSPGTLALTGDSNWRQGQNMTIDWLDRMSGRGGASPFRERMAFFWHGHLCSDLEKVNSARFLGEQIDLYRRDGVEGTIGQLLKDMSLQVAMLRYLDGDRNVASSPNQNFARELMELFAMGVGNYSEADVEAATAAWTGHTVHWETGAYAFRTELHEQQAQTFLGTTINDPDADRFEYAGYQTIDVMLWLDADYPAGSRTDTSRYRDDGGRTPDGRDTNRVAAEFLSRKLWQEFGEADSGGVPPSVEAAMVSALLDHGFAIRPWLEAMLTHRDFYPDANPAVAGGLVRQPVEYLVALMVATGRDASAIGQLWLMPLAGQVLLYPPNVSGWRPNGYWVNASAFEARNRLAQGVYWNLHETYWRHPWEQRDQNYLSLPGGRIRADEITGDWPNWGDDGISDAELVNRLLGYMDLRVSPATRESLLRFCAGVEPHRRNNVLLLVLLAPEMHVN